MSRRTDNRHRAATICRAATGLAHRTCVRWAADGLITRHRPVPDAGTPQQQAFEARLFAALAGGTVLALTAVMPSRTAPALALHADRAREFLDAVLPRLDGAGVLHGVPGLRLVPDSGSWWLADAVDRARVRLAHPRPGWQPGTSGREGGGPDRLWSGGRRALHPAEEAARNGGAGRGAASPDRDLLFSRTLRRLRLIVDAGAQHGWVNLDTTTSYDLVVDCCCASGALKLMRGLRQSLLAEDPEDDGPGYPGDIDVGGASVAVRHATCGSFPRPAGAWYPQGATC
ncbi:hypothetical protein ABZ891_14870 [Streptomyces sp. NPDC047023]|uniref:hypothetical protein n=1 Tax=Streptomyces sp. NPDC047023 TaxID=3155139 RepID=UPI0033C0E3BC